ncbi:MAG: DUF547 domain-containing protein [Flavobacteriales bacterium]
MKNFLFLIMTINLLHVDAAIGKHEIISQEFLIALRMNDLEKAHMLNEKIKVFNQDSLAAELNTDERKKAFWVNCYNAYIIYTLKNDSTLFENRGAFFTNKRVTIANKLLSFDDIEHGILRRSKNKLSLGYLGKIRVPKFEKKFRVKKVDYRIHFALNCGANSCPPVAYYSSANLDKELDSAAYAFLESSSKVDHAKKEATITPLMSWFRADFGGKKGGKKVLIKYSIITNKKYSVKFGPYDWTLNINNYK